MSKSYGELLANDAVDLVLWPREVHGILGENGAGKTTLMRVLYGLNSPDAGEVWVNGRPVAIGSPSDAIAAGIGMVTQHFSLVRPMTVAENIVLGRTPQVRVDLGRARRDVAVAAYVDGLEAADLFLLSGRGGLTDAFPGEADATLGELALATRMGKRIALLGQGIGPLTRRDLRRRAAAILPAVDLIALREDAAGPALLADLGVSPERIAITGDDAIALVDTPGESDARSIAVNIRVAQYAGVAPDAVAELSRAVRGVAEQLGAPVVPVALSTHPHEDDAAALAAGGFGGEPPRTPAQVIDRIGGARVMVTGSYHGAVFALSRGIPAVAISASPYYEGKFRGLRAMFGEGCEVVSLSGPEPAREVGIVARRLYESGPAPRAGLLAAAASQVEASRAAYARLAALAAQRAA